MKSSKLPGMLSVKSKKGLDYMDMILKTTDLCKNFKGQMAVNNVSLNIRRNSVYGLLGPNGAGKSTILKMLTGILRPTSGSIEFDGHPWKRNDLEHIGALIEMPPLYENLTAYENLKVRTTLLGLDDARINEVLQIVHIEQSMSGKFEINPQNATQLLCDGTVYQVTSDTVSNNELGSHIGILAENVIFNAETNIPLSKEELRKIDWYGENAGQHREQWIYKDIYEIHGTEKTEAVAVQINDRYYIAKRQ